MKRYLPHMAFGFVAVLLLGSLGCQPTQKAHAENKTKVKRKEAAATKPAAATSATEMPTVCVYPQFARARTRGLGVLELVFCEVCPHAPTKRSDKAIAVSTANGETELQLRETSRFYCVRELRAYRAGGSPLEHDDVLSAFRTEGVVLVTLAPTAPTDAHLQALAHDVIVLELPYRPRIKISATDLAAL